MKRALVLPFALTVVLSACTQTVAPGRPATPSTPVPSELVGSWFMGDLANTDYYDPHTGSWSDPSGYGSYFNFGGDGSYKHGAVFSSAIYSCTTKVFSFEQGTVEVNGETLVTHRQTGETSWSDSCGESGQNVSEPADTGWRWSFSLDETDQETLTLVTLDGSLGGTFRRWSE